jgi:endogenous inhibitor of DNA gyrase (YacG/DUF329 family)
MKRWEFICPICKKKVVNDYDVEEIKDYIGATYDCPECGETVRIKSDLTVENFETILSDIFSEVLF